VRPSGRDEGSDKLAEDESFSRRMNTSLCLKLRLGKQVDTDFQKVGAIDLNRLGGSGEPPLPQILDNRSPCVVVQFKLSAHFLDVRGLIFELRR